MDTSHSKGKSSGNPLPSKASATAAFWIRLNAKETSRPFAGSPSGLDLNDRGKALMTCWRELGRLRPGIQPDACAVGPHDFRGILMLAPDGAEPPTLSEAVRLFKVMAALRLSQLEKAEALPRNRQVTGARDTSPVSDKKRLPSALWQKGYLERSLATAQELTEAKKSL